MTSRNTVKIATATVGCASGLLLALVATASPAGAEPSSPALPPPPTPVPAPLFPAPPPAPAPGAPQAVDLQAAGAEAVVPPPNGIPHLASPDALPPGSTMDPNAASGDSPDVSYFKNLWQAVQNHEISGKEALVMGLAQRGMSTPMPEQALGPNVTISPADAPPPPAMPALGLAPAPLPPAPIGLPPAP